MHGSALIISWKNLVNGLLVLYSFFFFFLSFRLQVMGEWVLYFVFLVCWNGCISFTILKYYNMFGNQTKHDKKLDNCHKSRILCFMLSIYVLEMQHKFMLVDLDSLFIIVCYVHFCAFLTCNLFNSFIVI